MKFKSIIFLLFLALDVSGAEYYCSRSDIYFKYEPPDVIRSFGVLDGGIGGYSAPYIKNLAENHYAEGKISFKTTECSNEKFECLLFQSQISEKASSEFYLFVPRTIETQKEYIFNKMRLVTTTATISSFMVKGSSKFNVPTLQATLWQSIDGIEVPYKLTIEQGKGVAFWDGLNVSPEKFNIGETCSLQSKKGLFSDIKIKKIQFSGQSKVD